MTHDCTGYFVFATTLNVSQILAPCTHIDKDGQASKESTKVKGESPTVRE